MDKFGPLKSQIKQLISEEHLDDRQFSELRALLDKPGRFTRFLTRWQNAYGLAGMAAVVLLAITLTLPAMIAGHDLPEKIAEEVITNHLHIHPMNIETGSMEKIRAYFDRLDFVPQTSSLMPTAELIGGRYCTLQGAIATQLFFNSADGRRITQYQAAYQADRFGPLPDITQNQPPLELAMHGLQIRIWKENNLVMASARTP